MIYLSDESQETVEEQTVREELEDALLEGELGLAYAKGSYTPGTFLAKNFYIGCTPRRLILVRSDERERVYSIDHRFIKQVSVRQVSPFAKAMLEVDFGPERLVFGLTKRWQARANELAVQAQQAAAALRGEPVQMSEAEAVQQITDLFNLGMIQSAERVRKELPALNVPGEAGGGLIEQNARQTKETLLAMRVGAVIFTLVMGFMILMAVLGFARIGFGIILAAIAVFGLLRGQVTWRSQALVLAWLTAGINIAASIVNQSVMDGAMWLSFGVAMTLTLAGKSTRLRTVAGGAVFLVGFVGVLGVVFLLSVFSPGGYFQLMNGFQTSFEDDFSSKRGWTEMDEAEGALAVENGVLVIDVRVPQMTYYSFPPVGFQPTSAEFNAWVAPGYEAEIGTVGAVCHFRDEMNFLAVELDLPGQAYSVFRVTDGQYTVLNDPIWLELPNLIAGKSNRFRVECAGERISLTVNGEQVAELADPGRTDVEGEGMGLFNTTWENTGPKGFKVFFDDVKFSK